MSIPPLPEGLEDTPLNHTANALHSLSIHLLRRAREADKKSGLNPERLSILSILAFAGPQTINRLAELEQVSAPAISRIVTALEELGLAKRTRDEADARTVIVVATARGRKLVEAGRRRRLDLIAGELAGLSMKDLEYLSRVSAILEKMEAKRS